MDTYVKLQKVFVEENKLKKGDKVKVLFKVPSGKGWDCTWLPQMNRLVGKTFPVVDVECPLGIHILDEVVNYFLPFFCLEKVKETLENYAVGNKVYCLTAKQILELQRDACSFQSSNA